MSKRLLVIFAALAPLAAFGACTGDDTIVDGGSDAAKDTTTNDVKNDVTTDVATDTKLDTSADVTTDAKSDAATDAATDAETDAATDSATDAETDAETDAGTDAATDAETDSETDATADAADGGSMWNSPTCDGTISSGEYGGASNHTASGSSVWYMTWDATNLYVALTNANVAEATVLYVGFSGSGTQTSFVYDNTGGALPFLADAVVYAKSTYNEARTVDVDAGTWGNANASAIQFCDSGTTREEVIPWSALGATAIPSSFRFLAYATTSGGFIYAQIPTSNPVGQSDAGATYTHDFYVQSTDNGNGSFPFDTMQ